MPFQPLRDFKPDLFTDERVTDDEDEGDAGDLFSLCIEQSS